MNAQFANEDRPIVQRPVRSNRNHQGLGDVMAWWIGATIWVLVGLCFVFAAVVWFVLLQGTP